MHIDNTVSKDKMVKYETKSFKVINTFGHNIADVVETLCAFLLDIFTLYALNIPVLVEKGLGIFLRVLKGTAKIQPEEAIMGCQNQLLGEYDDEATRYISGSRKLFGFIKE